MLMKLLWAFAETPIALILGLIPGAPEPAELIIPWPAWLPSWPFTLALVTVTTAGVLFLALRVLRWVYGLIPVVQ